MTDTNCYCGSEKAFEACCAPYLSGKQSAPTSEALMRARYTAYATRNADYLVATTAPATRRFHRKADILEWSESNQWLKLDIIFSSLDIVEFKAYYLDNRLRPQVHHERSKFVQVEGKWYYLDHEG